MNEHLSKQVAAGVILFALALWSCGNARSQQFYQLEGIYIGMDTDELGKVHPGSFPFRQIGSGKEVLYLAHCRPFKTWTDVTVQATGDRKVSSITGFKSENTPTVEAVRTGLLKDYAKPDSETQRRSKSAQQTIWVWGEAKIAEAGEFLDVVPRFQCKARCIVASHTAGQALPGVIAIQLRDTDMMP